MLAPLPELLCDVAGADAAGEHKAPVAVETGGNRRRDAVCVRLALEAHIQRATVPAAPSHLQRRGGFRRKDFFCLKIECHLSLCGIVLI